MWDSSRCRQHRATVNTWCGSVAHHHKAASQNSMHAQHRCSLAPHTRTSQRQKHTIVAIISRAANLKIRWSSSLQTPCYTQHPMKACKLTCNSWHDLAKVQHYAKYEPETLIKQGHICWLLFCAMSKRHVASHKAPDYCTVRMHMQIENAQPTCGVNKLFDPTSSPQG